MMDGRPLRESLAAVFALAALAGLVLLSMGRC